MLVLALVFALILDSGRVAVRQALPRRVLRALRRADGDRRADVGLPLRRDFGPFADVADKLGVAPPNFLGESTMLWSIANVSTWTFTGYNMIIFYAALRAIPAELYEAAAVDGAGAVRTAHVHQAAAAAPGDPAVHDLLGDRLLPAVRRAADLLRRSRRR